MITITRAPPYLTVQDCGRKGSRASGVPPGGAMDSFTLRTANAVSGNHFDAAGLEWALGGGSITFEDDAVFSLGGAKAHATLAGKVAAPCTTIYAKAGDELTIEQITSGRFLYVAIRGGIEVPPRLAASRPTCPAGSAVIRDARSRRATHCRWEAIQATSQRTAFTARRSSCPDTSRESFTSRVGPRPICSTSPGGAF